ncbi:hypothetical protein CLV35_3793 [Motilibacter peucedani]|uniref:Uncharacterized protein n=1 Tax=Motilibacter peucedani TaxID=598650 RepID=A0A420XJN6_9ACTN|nr:hypothetical protein [Motilibacter peucedani]RKS67889.1 hypothetical protein CLV35_3793 [Motilibacter peucedani]
MSRLGASFFCFLHDALEVGVDEFCDRLVHLGATGVTVAVHYHASRDARPRTAGRTSAPGAGGAVLDLPPGASYFPTSPAGYPEQMPPWTPAPFDERDVLAELRAACTGRGLELRAWTVFGFDERLARLEPSLGQATAFGDRSSSDLCPADPVVRRGFVALARDVAQRAPDVLVAESLHYHGLRLSRSFFPLDSTARLALGLCFCEHCTAAAQAAGVDAGAVAAWARDAAGRAFAGRVEASERVLGLDDCAGFADGELVRFLHVRAGVVSSLAAEVAEATRSAGVGLCFMDQAAADQAVLGPGVLDEAFRAGVDVPALGRTVAEYQVLGYRSSADAVASDLAGYRTALGDGPAIRLALRPEAPDSTSAGDLAAKVRAAVEHGVTGVDFYHYGLVSDAGIDRAAEALARATGAT